MGIHEEVEREILVILKDKIINNVSAMSGHYTIREIATEVLLEVKSE